MADVVQEEEELSPVRRLSVREGHITPNAQLIPTSYDPQMW